MAENSFMIYTGAIGQDIGDFLKKDSRPLNLTGGTVDFKMRPINSSTLTASGTADIIDAAHGEVSYEWVAGDLDTPGEYMGWWVVTIGTEIIETPEFLIIVLEHSPGIRTRTGAIYQQARSIIPITWNALEVSKDYGDALLQRKVEVIKEITLGSGVSPDEESNLNIVVQQFLAKQAVVQVIPAGVDYWLSKPITVSTAPTQEIVTYEERIKHLWDLYAKLLSQIAEDQTIVDEILASPTTRAYSGVPEFSPAVEDNFKSPVSSDFFDYSFPDSQSWWD